MKTFIVSSALFLLLLFFPLQWSFELYNHNLRQNVDIAVNRYAQEARVTGRFTETMIENLKNEIHAKTNIPVSEITVNATMTPKYRRDMFEEQEFIDYDVRVPIPKIIAMASFFGLSDSENRSVYIRKGRVASEVLAP